jgi:hypothetical protein
LSEFSRVVLDRGLDVLIHTPEELVVMSVHPQLSQADLETVVAEVNKL